MHPTGTYYDRLSRWTAVSRLLGYGGGSETFTVHRALSDPRAQGRATSTRLHDLLVESLPRFDRPRVLDAGCGLGGTAIDLASRLGATCTGITLSAAQAERGRRAAHEAGLASAIEILVGDYDHPPAGPFDLIVAIESLAHSADPGTSVAALAARLAPGGCLAVVDDLPTAAARETADLALFKSGWRLPVLWTRAAFLSAFADLGLTVVVDRNLSTEVRPRSAARIRQLAALNRLAHALIPSDAMREMLDSYHGGLALERLYLAGRIEYRLMIARRPGNVPGAAV